MDRKNIIMLSSPAFVSACGSVVGEEEFAGPLGDEFDKHSVDGDRFASDTWEKAESEIQRLSLGIALEKAHLKDTDLDAVFAGDLINQCIGTNYGLIDYDVSMIGIYGACSTAAEGLALSSLAVSAGYFKNCAAVASSHNATAERQFRFPLEYGAQRTPTSQWTVTGGGAFIVSSENRNDVPYIDAVLFGRAIDAGITDVNNMGAAMAPVSVKLRPYPVRK